MGYYSTWMIKRWFWAGALWDEKPCPCYVWSGDVFKCAALSRWRPSALHTALSPDMKPNFQSCDELKCMFVYIPLFEKNKNKKVHIGSYTPLLVPHTRNALGSLWSAADLSRVLFVRSASPLPSTRGSDQCSFSRSLVMRCAEPLGATGSLAYSCSPSAGEASHIPN